MYTSIVIALDLEAVGDQALPAAVSLAKLGGLDTELVMRLVAAHAAWSRSRRARAARRCSRPREVLVHRSAQQRRGPGARRPSRVTARARCSLWEPAPRVRCRRCSSGVSPSMCSVTPAPLCSSSGRRRTAAAWRSDIDRWCRHIGSHGGDRAGDPIVGADVRYQPNMGRAYS